MLRNRTVAAACINIVLTVNSKSSFTEMTTIRSNKPIVLPNHSQSFQESLPFYVLLTYV
jgi:hypothetical protein